MASPAVCQGGFFVFNDSPEPCATVSERRRRVAAALPRKRPRKLPRCGRPMWLAARQPAHVKESYTVPVNTTAIGKQYEPTTYAVGREKIKEYARAVGETNPIHLDVQAARDAGYADVVAPPMFAVVYSAPSVGPPIFDPEIELNFALMVHGGQEFEWGPLVVAGDEITTTASVKDISESDGRGYYVFESISTNQRGEQVCRGTWTNIVRGV
jgi:acyl dehydratase